MLFKRQSVAVSRGSVEPSVDDLDFDGEKMLSYFFGSVYPMRVIDPNAILLMTAEGAGVASPSSPVDIGSAIITSDRILNDWRRDGFLLYSPTATSSKSLILWAISLPRPMSAPACSPV